MTSIVAGRPSARILIVCAAANALVGSGPLARRFSAAAPPTPDHVVIVIEENRGFSQVIGSASAPYINSLASSGARFSNLYAVTHPSQPNYLQFFSGSSQGVVNDTVPPAGSPYSTPNLGAELISAGASFVGYSEDLPGPGSTVGSSGSYMRKHNPWVNWQAAVPGPNQLPSTVNQPFTSFPTSFDDLPKVSIVVPNQQHDMHDGTVAQADTWLVNNIKPYADWAQTHNSLLIVTWDEDGGSARNRIPTILSGPMVQPVQISTTWTPHNLARTVEDMFGAAHAGSMDNVRSIVGAFTTDPQIATQTFQQGFHGVAHDTYIEQANPNATHAGDTQVVVDGSPLSQGLIRFDNLFGNGPGQVPIGAAILSAKLSLLTGSVSTDFSANTMSLHRMLMPWSDTSTWNSLGGGVATDDIQAASKADFSLLPNQGSNYAIFDVSDTAQAWASDPSKNFGWLINPSGTDGWRFQSSEFSTQGDRPVLQLTYAVPEPAGAILLLLGGLALIGFRRLAKRRRQG